MRWKPHISGDTIDPSVCAIRYSVLFSTSYKVSRKTFNSNRIQFNNIPDNLPAHRALRKMRFFLSVVIVTAIGAASAQVATRSAPSSAFSTAVSSTEQTSSSASVNSSTSLVLSQRTGSSHFAKVDGLKFNIDGESKYFAGTNSYWLPFLTNNADVDSVFKNLKNSGLKILRVWGFNDVNAVPKPGTVYF